MFQAGQRINAVAVVYWDPKHRAAGMVRHRERVGRDVAPSVGYGLQSLAIAREWLHGVDMPSATDPDGHDVRVDAAVGADVDADLGPADHVPDQPPGDIVPEAHLKRAQADAQPWVDFIYHSLDLIHGSLPPSATPARGIRGAPEPLVTVGLT
jgi:hypothetical protein